MLYCTQYQSNTKLGDAEIISSVQVGFSDKHKFLDSWKMCFFFMPEVSIESRGALSCVCAVSKIPKRTMHLKYVIS